MTSKELLKRIDERNYLTEREHREYLDRLNKDLEIKEKQDKILKFLNEYKELIKKRIEDNEAYKKYAYRTQNETEYFKMIGSIDAYGKVLDVLNEVLNDDR